MDPAEKNFGAPLGAQEQLLQECNDSGYVIRSDFSSEMAVPDGYHKGTRQKCRYQNLGETQSIKRRKKEWLVQKN